MRRLALVLALLIATPAATDQARQEEIALAGIRYALWHELAEFLAWQNRLPDEVYGVSALNAFATGRLLAGDDALDIERLLDVAALWLTAEERGDVIAYHGLSGMTGEAGRAILCLIAAEGPGRAHAMIGRWGLPRNRPASCAEDLADLVDATDELFDAARNGGAPMRVAAAHDGYEPLLDPWPDDADVLVTYRPHGDVRHWLAATGVLEDVAEALAAEFRWHGGFMLRADRCRVMTVRFDRERRVMTLCYELANRYRRLAGAIHSEE